MEPANAVGFSQSKLINHSKKLVTAARKMSRTELMEFMEISEKLAALNYQRFKDWKPPVSTDHGKQALFAFTGDVYEGLDAPTLKKRDIDYAQSHLRILSGLYGLLRPLDLILPYRLEMGRPLETPGAKNLYEFWRDTITDTLNSEKGDILVNLASQEYSKVIDTRKLEKEIVSPVFKDEKNGKLKIISFYAKKARGTMARYLIENCITNRDGITGFSQDGYTYNPGLSEPGKPVFTRPER